LRRRPNSERRQTGELGYGGGVLLFELGPDNAKEVARRSADIDAESR
jgi:hypothetical protein